jgi:acyl-CoA thioester hydrolase
MPDQTLLSLTDFPVTGYDKIRYGDTDRQGHVNNANFATFLETGRVGIIYNPEYRILAEGTSFVIASLHLDFIREMTWPGRVDIGTGVLRIGNSSMRLAQGLFQKDQLVAYAESVIVQVDDQTGKGKPLSPAARSILAGWQMTIPGREDEKP